MRPNQSPRSNAESLRRIRKYSGKVSRKHIKTCQPFKEAVCPFDPYHIVDENYLEKHISNCASRTNALNISSDFKKPLGTLPLETYKNISVPTMENWEEGSSTYDPYINTQTRNVIRYLILVPKREKKLFRNSERVRIQLLETTDGRESEGEVGRMLQSLGQDLLWDILSMYMKRLQIESFNTVMENLDFGKLFISEPCRIPVKQETTKIVEDSPKIMEEIINIEIENLHVNEPSEDIKPHLRNTDNALSEKMRQLVITFP